MLGIFGLSASDARAQLVSSIENEARAEATRLVAEVRDNAQRNAEEREARKIITLAIQRFAGEHAAEASVSVVHLPSDDMKGRIIGREGHNIRSFEIITGVDVIIDDTPEAVILSAFDPVRREVARVALERLIEDGRIHPARIEAMVEQARTEIDSLVQEAGEAAAFELGITDIHPRLLRLLGRLRFRTLRGYNLLLQSTETALLAVAAKQADPRAMVRALVKLYRENASTLTPDPVHSAFYDSHPPAAQRIAHLQAFT